MRATGLPARLAVLPPLPLRRPPLLLRPDPLLSGRPGSAARHPTGPDRGPSASYAAVFDPWSRQASV